MARERGTKPTHYIAVTAKTGKGRYEKGPYIGLWEGDDDRGPMFRGSVSGKYLDELADFIKDFGEDAISFAVFESRGKGGGRRNRDDDDDDDGDRSPRSRGRSSKRDRDDDDDRGSSRRGRGSKRERDDEDEDRGSKRGKRDKKSPWDD